MSFPVVAIVVLVGVGVVAFAIAAHLGEVKRRRALAALAAELQWDFDPEGYGDDEGEYAPFDVFRIGRNRTPYNTLRGDMEIGGRSFDVRMGDFKFQVPRMTGGRESTQTYEFSYLLVELPFPRIPDLLIRREGLLDRLAGVIGLDDIDFESDEFSRRFYVKSSDKRFAYAVIHPRMMEYLMQTNPDTVEIRNGRCCLSDGTDRWAPEEFRSRLGWLRAFFERWPDYLTSDLDRCRYG